jgi:hypothetical protein
MVKLIGYKSQHTISTPNGFCGTSKDIKYLRYKK